MNGTIIIQVIILIVLIIVGVVAVYLILTSQKTPGTAIFNNGETITLYDPYSQTYLGLCEDTSTGVYYLTNGFSSSDNSIYFKVNNQNPTSFANSYYLQSVSTGYYLDFSDVVNGVQTSTKNVDQLEPIQVNFNSLPDPHGNSYTKNGYYFPQKVYYGINISYGSANMGPDMTQKACKGYKMVAKFDNQFTYSYFNQN
jgi:hypothetical protein